MEAAPGKVVVKEHILTNGIGWDLRSTEATIPNRVKEEGSSDALPLFLVIVKVERCWVPYCWNVLLVLFFICIFLLIPYVFDYVEDFGDRMGFLITLFLAAVAYQVVVNSQDTRLLCTCVCVCVSYPSFGYVSFHVLCLCFFCRFSFVDVVVVVVFLLSCAILYRLLINLHFVSPAHGLSFQTLTDRSFQH